MDYERLEGFDESSPIEENAIQAATVKFSQSEDQLFNALGRLTHNPLRKQHAIIANQGIASTRESFHQLVNVIAADEELDIEERVNSIATVYCEAHDNRLGFFRELAPEADYDEGHTTSDQIRTHIDALFKAELDPSTVAAVMTDQYMMGLKTDLDELFQSADPGMFTKSVRLARIGGKHLAEVGKTSAALAIGTVVAHKLIKKLSD